MKKIINLTGFVAITFFACNTNQTSISGTEKINSLESELHLTKDSLLDSRRIAAKWKSNYNGLPIAEDKIFMMGNKVSLTLNFHGSIFSKVSALFKSSSEINCIGLYIKNYSVEYEVYDAPDIKSSTIDKRKESQEFKKLIVKFNNQEVYDFFFYGENIKSFNQFYSLAKDNSSGDPIIDGIYMINVPISELSEEFKNFLKEKFKIG